MAEILQCLVDTENPCSILNNPLWCFEQSDMVAEPTKCTQTYKSILHDKHNIAPTCFGLYFGHRQGNVVKMVGILRYYKSFRTSAHM